MKQAGFEARHAAEWARFEAWLDAVDGKARQWAKPAVSLQPKPPEAAELIAEVDVPAAYRRLCQHLALAERRGYGASLVERLRRTVDRGHVHLYRPPRTRFSRALGFMVFDVPALVRAQRGPMIASALLFFVPLLLCLTVLQLRPDLAGMVLSPEAMGQYERMYDPDSEVHGQRRGSESNLYMFGVYVLNNVSIAFRTFAAGLVVCIGSIFVLVFNGVMIGSVAGHLTAVGSGDPFWRFVAGHSGPELLGIVLSGGAGLRLGLSLLMPGPHSRAEAFRIAGTQGAKILLGVFVLLVFAAFVEAFWSSIGSLPAAVKYGAGIGLWVLLLAWLLVPLRRAEGDDAG
ncbi:MAG: stage II sporulation protein M [Lysobacteraceae bacterium]